MIDSWQERVRRDFPLLQQAGAPVYLDSAASTLKPQSVIDAIDSFYSTSTANVHRGAHKLSDLATERYESARKTVADFIHAEESSEIIFTRGTTESVNLVARALGSEWESGDEIVLTEMEHHSNIVPWQLLAKERDLKIKVIPVDNKGELELAKLPDLLSEKTKMVSLVYCSNSLGTINPIADVIRKAHDYGAKVFVDAAQAVSFMDVDVVKLDCDFLAFSGHKLFGPFGIGVLYGKSKWLNAMAPYQGGGSMIDRVSFSETTFADIPHKFEAGTPNVAGAVGLACAIDYVKALGFAKIQESEDALLSQAQHGLAKISGLRFVGTSSHRASILSFVFDGVHPSDVGQLLDQQGVAVRAGHHCCQPLMDKLGIPGTVRASFSIYNTKDDVKKFISAVEKAKELLS